MFDNPFMVDVNNPHGRQTVSADNTIVVVDDVYREWIYNDVDGLIFSGMKLQDCAVEPKLKKFLILIRDSAVEVLSKSGEEPPHSYSVFFVKHRGQKPIALFSKVILRQDKDDFFIESLIWRLPITIFEYGWYDYHAEKFWLPEEAGGYWTLPQVRAVRAYLFNRSLAENAARLEMSVNAYRWNLEKAAEAAGLDSVQKLAYFCAKTGLTTILYYNAVLL